MNLSSIFHNFQLLLPKSMAKLPTSFQQFLFALLIIHILTIIIMFLRLPRSKSPKSKLN